MRVPHGFPGDELARSPSDDAFGRLGALLNGRQAGQRHGAEAGTNEEAPEAGVPYQKPWDSPWNISEFLMGFYGKILRKMGCYIGDCMI